jgi:hypothetical protein
MILAGYFLALAALKLVGPVAPVTLDHSDGRFGVALVPLSATFFYLLAAFSFGLTGDLAARQSIYPARMFALPITTRALAGWPMLFGSAVMASLWLGTASFARVPWHLHLPFIWPALLGAVSLAWTQALTWMPYGLPGLRVLVVVLWLAALDAVVLLAIHFQASESLMVAILAPQLPLAYLTARFALARARGGDLPDWRELFAHRRLLGGVVDHRRTSFASALRAQTWFEWRRQGRTLPVLVAMLLPFELAFLYLVRQDPPTLVFETLFLILLTPPFMAAVAATTVGRSNPDAGDFPSLTPYVATRPLSSAELIAAKLKMAIWSTLAAWLLVFALLPLGLSVSGTWPMVIDRVDRLAGVFGPPRAIVILLLVGLALILFTWKLLVQHLCIGLTGRVWIIRLSGFLVLLFFILAGPVGKWISDDQRVQAGLWNALPWILGGLVSVKVVTATWAVIMLGSRRLLSDRAMVTGAACWVVAVLALYGLLAWLFYFPLMPRYLLGLLAILFIPLSRLFAAPLALAWNRHR